MKKNVYILLILILTFAICAIIGIAAHRLTGLKYASLVITIPLGMLVGIWIRRIQKQDVKTIKDYRLKPSGEPADSTLSDWL